AAIQGCDFSKLISIDCGINRCLGGAAICTPHPAAAPAWERKRRPISTARFVDRPRAQVIETVRWPAQGPLDRTLEMIEPWRLVAEAAGRRSGMLVEQYRELAMQIGGGDRPV